MPTDVKKFLSIRILFFFLFPIITKTKNVNSQIDCHFYWFDYSRLVRWLTNMIVHWKRFSCHLLRLMGTKMWIMPSGKSLLLPLPFWKDKTSQGQRMAWAAEDILLIAFKELDLPIKAASSASVGKQGGHENTCLHKGVYIHLSTYIPWLVYNFLTK